MPILILFMSKIKFNKFNILLIIRIMINHKIRIFQILLFNKQIICIRIINKFRHRILKILRVLINKFKKISKRIVLIAKIVYKTKIKIFINQVSLIHKHKFKISINKSIIISRFNSTRILQINNQHIKIKLIVMISNKLVKFKRFFIFRKEDMEDRKNQMKYIFIL